MQVCRFPQILFQRSPFVGTEIVELPSNFLAVLTSEV